MTPVPQLAPEAESPEPKAHLPTLPPLFLPPPFTPSHPAFSYLSSIANSESQAIRDATEEYLARVTQEKLAEIRAHETRLRQQTESLWARFRLGLEKFGGDKRDHQGHSRRESGKWNAQGDSPSPGALVTIHDFIPAAGIHPRSNGGDLTPKASALSTSLVGSGFHHPKERGAQSLSNSPQPPVISDPTESPVSPDTASSATMTNYIKADETNDILEPFKRDMSDSKDLATSLLVLNLEAQMERRRRANRTETAPESSARGAQQSDTTVAEVTQPNNNTTEAINGVDASLTQSPPPNPDQLLSETELTSPKAKKGKRKVTFDVQADVVTIKRDVTKEQEADPVSARINGQVQGLFHSTKGCVYAQAFRQFRFLTSRKTSTTVPLRPKRPRHPFSRLPRSHGRNLTNARAPRAVRDLAYLNRSPLYAPYPSHPPRTPDS